MLTERCLPPRSLADFGTIIAAVLSPSVAIMKHILLIVCLLAAISCRAIEISGYVVDSQRQPIPYASVYLQNRPQIGTMADSAGHFALQGGTRADTAVISFIGYETCALPVERFWPDKTLRITLKDQPIMLDAVVVAAKGNKRQQRKALRELLAQIGAQLKADFPDEARDYRVVSRISVYNDGQMAGFDEMVGDIVELPYLRNAHKRDSIQVKADFTRYYLAPQIDDGLRHFDQSLLKRQEKRQLQRIDFSQSEPVHRALWAFDVTEWFDKNSRSTSRWSIAERDSESQMLTHTATYRLPGIFNATLRTHLFLDKNLHLLRLAQSMDVEADIPFGYKLSDAQLAALNAVLVGSDGNTFEKYRLKTVAGHIERNVLFVPQDGQMVVSEKNWAGDVRATDNNGRAINFDQKTTINVLSVRTTGVTPYTRGQLATKAKRTQIFEK